MRKWLLGGPAPGEINSVAVLPLGNLSGDPEQEYFVDGMTDALIIELSRIGALKVISRTSVMQYKETRKSLPDIARELDVDAVVEGSVLRAGNTVRVTAQLIEARTDRHLWADNFDRELSDILALHSEVARAIADEIQVALTPAEEARLANARPVNPEAYEAVLKGNYFYFQRTEEGLTKGLEYFQQAIEIDPNYAPAYLGVADSYLVMASWALIPPTEAHLEARGAVMKALEIDDTLGHAHADLAGIRYEYEWDWAAAEQEFQRALELNPNFAGIHRYHAEFLSTMEDHAQAIAEARRAHELSPLQLIAYTMVGVTLHNARQYDQAIEQCQEVLELDPSFVRRCTTWGGPMSRRVSTRRPLPSLRRRTAFPEAAAEWPQDWPTLTRSPADEKTHGRYSTS
jgi:TolB-like protein